MSAHGAIVLAATLPDPGNPSIAGLASGLGMFVGWLTRLLGGPAHDQTSRLIVNGTAIGFGIGFASWIVAIAVDLL